MKINKAYKFRLDPNEAQEQAFNQCGGNTRFVWNLFLDLNQEKYEESQEFIWKYDLCKMLPSLKKQYAFLKESYSQSLQQVTRQFDQALKDYLNPELNRGFPKHKHKRGNDSFTVPQHFKIHKNYIYIPKIGDVKWIKHQPIKGKVKKITITQDGDQWYCSVLCELKIKDKELPTDNIVGIDVGLKTFATMSDNTKVENPKIMQKLEKKLKRTQRRHGKKKKQGKNREKLRKKLHNLHRKIRNKRKDFQHKETCRMIAKYDGVIVETLNIAGMMKNHCLAKAVQDCAWFEFKRQLKYKALWNSKIFAEIDRWEPTSKTCRLDY